jgi:hypothetical protein
MTDENKGLNAIADTDAGSSDTATAETGAGGKTDGSKEPTPDELKKQLADLTAEHEEVSKKYEGLKKRVGEQGMQLNVLKQFGELQEKNPRGLVESIAKKAGLKLTFEETDLGGDTDDDSGKTIKQLERRIMTRLESGLLPLHQARMIEKYPDFEEKTAIRQGLASIHQAGRIPDDELYHLAVMGMTLPDVVRQAKELGKQEYLDSLNKKNAEQIDVGSGGPDKGKKGILDFSEAVKSLAGQFP